MVKKRSKFSKFLTGLSYSSTVNILLFSSSFKREPTVKWLNFEYLSLVSLEMTQMLLHNPTVFELSYLHWHSCRIHTGSDGLRPWTACTGTCRPCIGCSGSGPSRRGSQHTAGSMKRQGHTMLDRTKTENNKDKIRRESEAQSRAEKITSLKIRHNLQLECKKHLQRVCS